jgi:hypothetical protein
MLEYTNQGLLWVKLAMRIVTRNVKMAIGDSFENILLLWLCGP